MWATLQFKWIQLQYPVVCLAFERLLFAATPPVAAMILTWGALAAVGPAHAPFYQAALLSGAHLVSSMPCLGNAERRSGFCSCESIVLNIMSASITYCQISKSAGRLCIL